MYLQCVNYKKQLNTRLCTRVKWMKAPCRTTTTKQVGARVDLFRSPAVSGRNPNTGLPYIDLARAGAKEREKWANRHDLCIIRIQ